MRIKENHSETCSLARARYIKNENLVLSKLNQDQHGVLNIRFIARFGVVHMDNDIIVYTAQVGFESVSEFM